MYGTKEPEDAQKTGFSDVVYIYIYIYVRKLNQTVLEYIYICKYILDFNIGDTCIPIMECSE